MLLDTLKSVLIDPPPGMAFEISEAGIAAARIGAKTEMEFQALKGGTIVVSPLKENVLDVGEFAGAVKALSDTQMGRKRKDVALILPDFCVRMAVLDFDSFPSDAKEQAALVRFRLKRSVPFDVEAAALSYWPQTSGHGHKRVEVVVVVAPLKIVTRYEAPFRAAGMVPGLVTTSSLAALELAPDVGLNVLAKITGHVLTLVVREKATVKLVRCLELSAAELDDIAAVLQQTFVYVEDNLGGRAERLILCGLGAGMSEAQHRFQEELGVEVEPLRSPLGTCGEHNAGLLGYLRSISKDN